MEISTEINEKSKTTTQTGGTAAILTKIVETGFKIKRKKVKFEENLIELLRNLQGETYDTKLKELCSDENRIRIILRHDELLARLSNPAVFFFELVINHTEFVLTVLSNEIFIKTFNSKANQPYIDSVFDNFLETCFIDKNTVCAIIRLCKEKINTGQHIESYQTLIGKFINRIYADENTKELIAKLLEIYLYFDNHKTRSEAFVFTLIGFNRDLIADLANHASLIKFPAFKEAITKIRKLVIEKDPERFHRIILEFCQYNSALLALLNDELILKRLPKPIVFIRGFINKNNLGLISYIFRHDAFINLFEIAAKEDIKCFCGNLCATAIADPNFTYQLIGFCLRLKLKNYDRAYEAIMNKVLAELTVVLNPSKVIYLIYDLCFKDDSLSTQQKIVYMSHFYQFVANRELHEKEPSSKESFAKIKRYLLVFGQDLVARLNYESTINKGLKEIYTEIPSEDERLRQFLELSTIMKYAITRDEDIPPPSFVSEGQWKDAYCNKYNLKDLQSTDDMTYVDLYYNRVKLDAKIKAILKGEPESTNKNFPPLFQALDEFYRVYKDYSAGLALVRLIVHKSVTALPALENEFTLNYAKLIVDNLVEFEYELEVSQGYQAIIADLLSADATYESQQTISTEAVSMGHGM